MTRKDFILIASVIARQDIPDREREALARDMADALATTNPLFNRGKFLDAATTTK